MFLARLCTETFTSPMSSFHFSKPDAKQRPADVARLAKLRDAERVVTAQLRVLRQHVRRSLRPVSMELF